MDCRIEAYNGIKQDRESGSDKLRATFTVSCTLEDMERSLRLDQSEIQERKLLKQAMSEFPSLDKK